MDEHKQVMQIQISCPALKEVLEVKVLLVCQQSGQALGILLAALAEAWVREHSHASADEIT